MRRAGGATWIVGCALVASAALAASASAGTVERTFSVRWPAQNGAQIAYVKPIWIGSARGRSVSVTFPGGSRVGADPGVAYVVACAHRHPAVAKLLWLQLAHVVWVSLVLETGGCSPGPTVAGTTARITVTVATSS
jgi:hypothetical protein